MAASKIYHSIDDLNQLMAIPKEIRTDDGRRIHTTRWAPVSEVGGLVTVSIEAVIRKEPEPTP